MRLSNTYRKIIKKTFLKVFNEGSIYLFGSRVNDNARGGDIDLFLDVPYSQSLHKLKIQFLVELELALGEQKIDVVISRDKKRDIEVQAIKTVFLL